MRYNGYLEGFGSIFELFPGNEPAPEIKISNQSDAEALKSDWKAVGDDMRAALSKFPHDKEK